MIPPKNFESGKRQSLLRLALFDALAVLVSVVFVLIREFSRSLPCITKTLFKIYCPACGGTRAVSALLRLDISASLRHNPIVLYIAICILLINILAFIAIKKNRSNIFYAWRVLVYGGILILTVYFIVKNVLLIFFKIDLSNELIAYWT